jgi:hypothetical protein
LLEAIGSVGGGGYHDDGKCKAAEDEEELPVEVGGLISAINKPEARDVFFIREAPPPAAVGEDPREKRGKADDVEDYAEAAKDPQRDVDGGAALHVGGGGEVRRAVNGIETKKHLGGGEGEWGGGAFEVLLKVDSVK